MARQYEKIDFMRELAAQLQSTWTACRAVIASVIFIIIVPWNSHLASWAWFIIAGIIPAVALFFALASWGRHSWIEKERLAESARRNGAPVIGFPPDREAFSKTIAECKEQGNVMIDKYVVGFEIDSGKPILVTDDELCGHGCVFAKTGVGKTLWLEGLMFQQMARGRASGLTFIDAKRDPGTLADIILMALITGRIEDLIVIDPFDPVCAYNFVFTTQRADVKARKVLRCGLPPTSDQSTTKHYDRLAADAVYRVVRAMESLGLAWSVRDVAVALSAFTVAYPRLRGLLHEKGAKQAMVELGHLASSYRTAKGGLDSARLTDNLRGIASELHSISNSEAGEMFCAPRADLSLTDAIRRGKIIYYMLPRLEEAESAARMVKVFREDLEVSIGEITSSRGYRLEDPHMVMIDEGASTFGPTWANLFELARKGRFALLFGAQSIGGLMDTTMGLSEQFYERVIANVNLKVIMRIGDNRTALDMSEWIGKITKQKQSVSTAASIGINARELTKNLEINRRSSDSLRDGITIAEDEEDLVSPEELKHEMSAEKGLAWFDKGDGRLRKGRAIWFDGEVPTSWEGREFLVRYEAVEADEIGLAEWVDEHILSVERAETERDYSRGENSYLGEMNARGKTSANGAEGMRDSSETDQSPEEPGSFRINLFKGFKGIARSRTTIVTGPAPVVNTTNDKVTESSSNVPEKKTPQGKSDSSAQTANKPRGLASPKFNIQPNESPKKKFSLGGTSTKSKQPSTGNEKPKSLH
ncbi:MAG: TraM recognition domain-containing protein [Deltaproteobacteria bacterium]|nr:TraM recognition domain-containing protein [Deltaproteobacteria bacterium]